MRNQSIRRQAAFEHNKKGIQLQRSGDIRGAIPCFSRAIELDPSIPVFWINRGDCFAEVGNLEEALVNFDRAIELDPRSEWRFERGVMLVRHASQLPAQQHSLLERAIEDLNHSAPFEKNEAAIYWRGWAYSLLGEHGQALDDFKRAQNANQNNPVIYRAMGLVYDQLGLFQEAIAAYDRAITLGPTAELFSRRAGSIRRSGDCHGAICDYTRAIELEGNNADTLCSRADTHMQIGNYSAALYDLTDAIDLEPDEILFHWRRADALFMLGRLVHATNSLKNAIRVVGDPTSENASLLYSSLSLVYAFRNEHEKASRWLSRARKHWLQSIPLSRSHSRDIPVSLVVANTDLFRPGLKCMPSLVLLTFDESLLANRPYLSEIATKLVSMKDKKYDDPDMAYAAYITTNEWHSPEKRLRIPRCLAGDFEIYAVHLDIQRIFLPKGILTATTPLYARAEPGSKGPIYHIPPP